MSQQFGEQEFASEMLKLLQSRFEQEMVFAMAGYEKSSDPVEMIRTGAEFFASHLNQKWGTAYQYEVLESNGSVLLRLGAGVTNSSIYDLSPLVQYYNQTPTPFQGHP